MREKPIFDIILLIARPAAGKSEVIEGQLFLGDKELTAGIIQ